MGNCLRRSPLPPPPFLLLWWQQHHLVGRHPSFCASSQPSAIWQGTESVLSKLGRILERKECYCQ